MHEGLMCKLAKDGVPAQIIRFLGNWLMGWQLKVRIGKEYSNLVQLGSGVPQGSVTPRYSGFFGWETARRSKTLMPIWPYMLMKWLSGLLTLVYSN